MTEPDPRLRFRMWIDGELVSCEWVNVEDPGAADTVDAIQHGQMARAELANHDGELWLIEVFDPEAPPGEGYVRFGTDRGAMILPVETIHLPEM